MSACSQCGTVAKATDKFCNVCGTPLARSGPPNRAGAGRFGAAIRAHPTGRTGRRVRSAASAGLRRAQRTGRARAPPWPAARWVTRSRQARATASQGHPIALDQMQFASDAYGAGAPAFGQRPQAAAYGAPQPMPGYGPGPQQPGYAPQGGAPPLPPLQSGPLQHAYAPTPGPPFGAPPGGQPGYAPQPNYAPGPPGGYGAAPAAPTPFLNDVPAPPKILRGFLVAYGANPNGDFWPLTGGRLLVGRLGATEGIDVSMQDPTISSRHAAMVVDAASGSIVVEDTGSTNGTFVNDEHIGFNGRRELRDGDRLRFGGYTAVVKIIGRV